MSGATYSSAGVDLELYRQGMARLPAHMRRTQCPRVMSPEGGFAALFQLDFKGLFARGYEDPLLVSCTDGVGTKLKIAVEAGIHHTVGIDLVAMSVNDALCTGAEPLFFLDYVAMPRATSPGWISRPSTSFFRSTTPTQKPARSYSPRWYMSGRIAVSPPTSAHSHSTQASAMPRTICSSRFGSSCDIAT